MSTEHQKPRGSGWGVVINLEELKRLAEAATKAEHIQSEFLRVNGMDGTPPEVFDHTRKTQQDLQAAANPSTILSLIERVVEAEAHVTRLQHAVGGASIAAYQRGMEDAAKVADEHGEIVSNEAIGKACASNISRKIREKAKAGKQEA